MNDFVNFRSFSAVAVIRNTLRVSNRKRTGEDERQKEITTRLSLKKTSVAEGFTKESKSVNDHDKSMLCSLVVE